MVICAKRGGYVQVVSEGCREEYVQRVARRTVRVCTGGRGRLGLDGLLLLGGLRGGLALLPLPEAVLVQCINHRDCRREIILPTGTLLCFALMYAVATGAKLYNLNPIDATSVLGHDAGLRGLRDARRRHDPTRPLRHRDLCLLAVSRNRARF